MISRRNRKAMAHPVSGLEPRARAALLPNARSYPVPFLGKYLHHRFATASRARSLRDRRLARTPPRDARGPSASAPAETAAFGVSAGMRRRVERAARVPR